MRLSSLAAVDVATITAARWFQGKGSRPVVVDITATVRVPGGDGVCLAVLRIEGDDGSRRLYVAPIEESSGSLVEPAHACAALWRGLADTCVAGVDLEGDGCRVRASAGPAATLPIDPGEAVRPASSEQTHSSFVIGERLLAKCYRGLSSDSAREPVRVRRLTAAGARGVPPMFGSAELELGDERFALLMLQQYIPDSWEGFEQARRDLEAMVVGGRGVDPAGWATAAGIVVSDLHGALAASVDPAPGPAREEDVTAWRERALRQAATASARARDQDRPLLARGREATERAWDAAASEPPPLVAAAHGDLHLSQLLLHSGGPPYVVDFEAAPSLGAERFPVAEAPAQDLASLLRSVSNAGRWAARAGGTLPPGDRLTAACNEWISQVRTAMEHSYHADRHAHGRPPIAGPLTLRAFELSQAFHEYLYAVAAIPAWLPVAVAGMAELVGDR